MLLVDDDAPIRRFVAMVLEDLDVELLTAGSVDEALALLRDTGPVQLVITDLMMPGSSGTALLQALVDLPGLRGQARLAVLSAGLDKATLDNLAGLDVWRTLRKPVSVADLKACVSDAVQAVDAPAQQPAPPGPRAGPSARSAPSAASVQPGPSAGVSAGPCAAPPAAPGLAPAEQQAVERHFGGDQTLFTAFRAASLAQFPDDVACGDAALARADAATLRRVAHSLKSVLTMLGQDGPAASARALEQHCAAGDWAAAAPLWPGLRDTLVAQPVQK